MADSGGHGVDEYLENNFQLPNVIMAGVASGADLGDVKGRTMTVDRMKRTLPQEVTALVEEAMSVLCLQEAPAPLHRYIAAKGSITVDGVSLTVNAVEGQVFGLNIIPHTWEATTLGGLKAGDAVNLEIDMLARYLARWQETA